MPLKAMYRSLLSVATGLCSGDHGSMDVLEVTVETVCRNAINMLRSASPVLERIMTTLGPFAILAFGIYKWGSSGLETKDYIYKKFMVDVTVPGGTKLNKQVVDYMADHSGSTSTRSMMVMEDHLIKASTSSNSSECLMYIPKRSTDGYLRFDNRWLKFAQTAQIIEQLDDDGRRRTKAQSGESSKDVDVVISAFSLIGSVGIIQRFLEHVHDINIEEVIETEHVKAPTRITRLARRTSKSKSHPGWGKPISKAARDMSSVTMEAETKKSLLADIQKYNESRMWYHNRGIGWRRGYLLYGPPGTGKTSITTAIAGHFDLPLFIISFADSLTDDALETAFDNLPSKCVVLMEDIDSAGIGREAMTQGEKGSKKSLKKTITLSGLLNAIDGPVAKEGRILIMTSNTPDSLDPALVRPGRIDRKVLFGYAKNEVIAKLFIHIFSDDNGGEKDPDLTLLSEKFASSVPENKLTPAEIQGFLLVNRDDPQEAVRLAKAWADELVATKSKGSNVAQFNGQIGVVDSSDESQSRGRSRGARSDSIGGSGSLVSKSSVYSEDSKIEMW